MASYYTLAFMTDIHVAHLFYFSWRNCGDISVVSLNMPKHVTRTLNSECLQDVCTHVYTVQLIALAFECCAYCILCISYCVARQHDKNYQFSWLQNIKGSKRRFNRPFQWHSVKLFTTNQMLFTTNQVLCNHHMQHSMFKHKCN